MIALTPVKKALQELLDGHEDFRVITHLGALVDGSKGVPLRQIVFGDGIGVDSNAFYDIDGKCGTTTVEFVERTQLILWFTVRANNDALSFDEMESIRTYPIAHLIKTLAADPTLGVEIPGVRKVSVTLTRIDGSNTPMSSDGGARRVAARAAVELDLKAWLRPSKLQTGETNG